MTQAQTPTPEFYIYLGERLKEARLAQKKTLKGIAQAVGVHMSMPSSWEKAQSRIRVDQLVKVCDYLNVDPGQLLKDVKSEMPY